MNSNNKSTLFILGGASTALEIREVVDTYYFDNFIQVYNVIGNNEQSCIRSTIKDSELDETLKYTEDIDFILGFTDNALRIKFRELLTARGGREINIIHPTSIVSPSAHIGKGNYLAANTVVSSNAFIGDSSIINLQATVGHDAHISNDCIINPGARISGHVKICENTLVGANSVVFQGITVGKNCIIDAMTYIDRDIEENQMCTNRMGVLKVYKRRIF